MTLVLCPEYVDLVGWDNSRGSSKKGVKESSLMGGITFSFPLAGLSFSAGCGVGEGASGGRGEKARVLSEQRPDLAGGGLGEWFEFAGKGRGRRKEE